MDKIKQNPRITEGRRLIYEMYQNLKDFIIAYDNQEEEQLLSVYHAAAKATEEWEILQENIKEYFAAKGEYI